MNKAKNFSHFVIEERQSIQQYCYLGQSISFIAEKIGHSKSSVAREISIHRILKYRCNMPLECSNYRDCKYGRRCKTTCPGYIKFVCKRRDSSPKCCNGCEDYRRCRMSKYYYDAFAAEKEYTSLLKSSREGINQTKEDIAEIAKIVVPLIKQGQSPYVIITNHKELELSEKTLYNYIELGAFREFGLLDIDLRVKVSRKMSKDKKVLYKKREDRSFLKGRTYDLFLVFMKEHPNAELVEMDTVYNDISNGPFMQTFKFIKYGIMIILYHEKKTSETMCDGIDFLYETLGEELFKKYVQVILTDRGSEFSNPVRMETSPDDTQRCLVFYCDPMASGQKGSLENNHKEIRYVCPKEKDLYQLGLTSQDACNKLSSHIASYKSESLNNKTPWECLKFFAPDLANAIAKLGIEEIQSDKVVLKPELLASFKK